MGGMIHKNNNHPSNPHSLRYAPVNRQRAESAAHTVTMLFWRVTWCGCHGVRRLGLTVRHWTGWYQKTEIAGIPMLAEARFAFAGQLHVLAKSTLCHMQQLLQSITPMFFLCFCPYTLAHFGTLSNVSMSKSSWHCALILPRGSFLEDSVRRSGARTQAAQLAPRLSGHLGLYKNPVSFWGCIKTPYLSKLPKNHVCRLFPSYRFSQVVSSL